MATLDRGGVSINYSTHGEGVPLLLSHGYGATERMWQPQVAALSARYKLITWDMRGHGQTDSPDDPTAYSEAATVEDIAGILDAVGAEQAVIGGLSLGGYMTLAFHYAHPERCRALILCDTGPGYRNPKSREGWNETAERRAVNFETKGIEALGRSPELEASRGAQRSAQGLANAARGMLAQADSRIIDSLPDIKVPVLVIVGENDTPFLAGTDFMVNAIPGARKVVIPDAGHASNIDQPERFTDAIVSFLDEVGVPSRR